MSNEDSFVALSECHFMNPQTLAETNYYPDTQRWWTSVDGVMRAWSGRDLTGEWPADSDAELTVFMKAMLAAGANGTDIVKGVMELDLLDLADASDEQLGRVNTLAWSVKKLFSKLENTQMSEAMNNLPGNLNGAKIDRAQMAQLTAIMSHDVIRSGNREWFPNLADDLDR